VLYVNPPIDRRTLLSAEKDEYTQRHIQDIKDGKKGLLKVTENLAVLNPGKVIESINWIPSTFLFSFFNRLNNKNFASCIQQAIDQLQFESFVLINDKDMFRSFYLKEFLRPSLTVYLDRDYTLGFDYWKKHGTSLEPKLMKKSDLVVCNSMDFTRRALRYNANSFYIGNGADLEVFDDSVNWSKPQELDAYKRPLIGYVGALNSMRIDIKLIEDMAVKRSDWDFVFIGSEDDAFRSSILHEIPNISFLSKKHTNEVPAYVKHFDVCINPQLINEITIGNFPLKIIEYLALGRPVVATETNTMKEVFSEVTYLASDADGYITAIERALDEDNEERQASRIVFAKRYSWKAVSEILLDNIQKVANAKGVFI
jgi:glycosyltransferase involved in cell wall biosynthesis